ncbi:MAG TPA: ATP-binding protein [Burkholderiales bacterium]
MAAARSFQQKLGAMVLGTTLAALLVAIAAMVAYDLQLYHRSWIADLDTQAELLARTSAAALAFNDESAAKENLALLRYRPEVHAAAIYDARGRLFASFSMAGKAAFPELPDADGVRIEGGDIVAFKRIVNNREILGTVYLRAEYELYERLLGYLGIAAVVALAALLVAYALSRWLQRVVTRPLASIARAAKEVSEKRNFSLRVDKVDDDEIGYLADTFNRMLAEIETSTRDLKSSNEEVLRLNAELEQRVAERTSQLEYTNKELEAFCYSVSHDLRAPLRSIDGFSQALVEDFPREVPAEAQRYLARIRAATQRMAQLIEDLLNLSRVSRGELQRQDIDIGEIARHVVAELQQREPGRKAEVTIWDGMQASADARLVRAALENLVGNAWKFTARCAAPRIEIGALADGGRATYFVRDNGAGFDMAYADKLFGAFQRLHSANEYAGTGIGLATVQRIVHRHGGRVWADAKPGKGAVFYFTLEPGGG